ncbi:MAG: peptide deformylase [Planctomycetota bacterium]
MPLSIIHYPHPTLRHKSRPVARVDRRLKSLVDEMLDLMYQHDGVGLAANQVDLPIRLFVANPSGTKGDGEEWVVINPEIDRHKGSEADREGCLSLPGLYGQVKRPRLVRLQGYDLAGKEIKTTLDGFLGRIVQHETDHLDGVLFFDRMTEESRREVEGPLDEFESEFRALVANGTIGSDETLLAQRKEWEDAYT